ncbi:MAG: hypothetical protein KCHDKBKB_01638 [Elusimicrobia bacterium]|nr:hypothetical protein [Elusimicrobiota bacterium]
MTSTRCHALAFLFLIVGVCPARIFSAEKPKTGTLSFVLENDLFYGRDQNYTNGLRFTWVPGPDRPPPRWALKWARFVPWFPDQGVVRPGYAFGQSMFTPKDITLPDPPLWDRPYAGWLFATVGLGVEADGRLDQFGVSLGVVGPASLAEQSQKFVHKVIGAPQPHGWDTQLHNEVGIVVTSQRSWRDFAKANLSGVQLDLTPHLGAALGNVFTYANTGLTMRLGVRLPKDYGPPRVLPGLPGAGDFAPVSDFGWYIFGGVDGRAVAQNIFLDGNTFRDSRTVDKEPFVGDFQFGFVVDWPDIRLGYTHVFRSREFTTADGSDEFGAVAVSFKVLQ